MKICKISAIICGLVLVCLALLPAARADTYNQATELVFNQSVEIPGEVLPAGTYWFVLQDNISDRNVVEIFNADRSQLEAILIAVPAVRQQTTSETEIKFAERPHDKPEALLKWFYPGQLEGHEFIYSKRHEREFARDAQQDVLTEPTTIAQSTLSPRP